MANESGFYNLNMALAIVSSLATSIIMNRVPAMPTVVGQKAHIEQGLWHAQEVLGLVHRPMYREEIASSEGAKQALMQEADEMRRLKVWNEAEAIEVDSLLQWSRSAGQDIHIADIRPYAPYKMPSKPLKSKSLKVG